MNALLSLFCLSMASVALHADTPASINVTLRTRVQPFKNLDEWKETTTSFNLAPKDTAIVICDMWDKHWCPSASRRCGEMAVKMADVVNVARKKGILIIHAPSDTMSSTRTRRPASDCRTSRRSRCPSRWICPIRSVPSTTATVGATTIRQIVQGVEPATRGHSHRRGTRRHLRQRPRDLQLSERERHRHHPDHGSPHQHVRAASVVRDQTDDAGGHAPHPRADLTDSMYNPKSKPMVTHDEGTQRIVQFIENTGVPLV